MTVPAGKPANVPRLLAKLGVVVQRYVDIEQGHRDLAAGQQPPPPPEA